MNDIDKALEIIDKYTGLEHIISQEELIDNQIEKEFSWNNYAEGAVKRYLDYKNKPIFKKLFYWATNTKKVKTIKQEYTQIKEKANLSFEQLNKCMNNFSRVNKDLTFLNETIGSFDKYLNSETYNRLNENTKKIKHIRNKVGIYLSALQYRILLLSQKKYFEPESINFERGMFNSVYNAV